MNKTGTEQDWAWVTGITRLTQGRTGLMTDEDDEHGKWTTDAMGLEFQQSNLCSQSKSFWDHETLETVNLTNRKPTRH